jgi:hypothetical protein
MHYPASLAELARPLGLRRLLVYHLTHHPAFAVRDLYKLLHQACLGPAHLGRSSDSFRWLLDEWERTVPTPGDLLEPIDPRGRIVRLNLSPFKGARGSVLGVWRMMRACPREGREERARLERLLRASVELAARGIIPLSGRELLEQATVAREAGYPPGRHSPEYLSAERPTYRVAPLRLVEQRWDDLLPGAHR